MRLLGIISSESPSMLDMKFVYVAKSSPLNPISLASLLLLSNDAMYPPAIVPKFCWDEMKASFVKVVAKALSIMPFALAPAAAFPAASPNSNPSWSTAPSGAAAQSISPSL